jgi:hypothetical protein
LTDRITLSAALLRHVAWEVRRGAPETVKTLIQGEHSGPCSMADPSQRSSCRTLSQTWVTQ